MKQFVDLITTILKDGRVNTDRTGVGTVSTFGHQSVFYMKDGFPLLTLKKTFYKGIIHELLWFLNAVPEEYKKFGNTNIKYLVDNNVHIWDEWAYAKYKKFTSTLEELDMSILVDDPSKNCVREMTQKEFAESIKNDNEFALKWGDLGPVYGKQWTDWGGKKEWQSIGGMPSGGSFGGGTLITGDHLEEVKIDGINQIDVLINTLKNRPDDRGIVVSAWDVAELGKMALRPCHTIFQFKAEPLTTEERVDLFIKDGGDALDLGVGGEDEQVNNILTSLNISKFRLSLQLYQRSQDHFLGASFNIASYALLLHMVAQVVNMVPYKFVHTSGDVHLYSNHKDQVNEFLNRTREKGSEIIDFYSLSKEEIDKNIGSYYGPSLPKLRLNPEIKNIFDFKIEDIEIVDYNPLSAIKAPVAI